ncbi:hypothetical protein BGZ57DRAFT_941948 [Hyaloscypha finlandica]|nr:hypothetical protein BGZ57DRAFT_941948 [Hyaloscypha finlandica]
MSGYYDEDDELDIRVRRGRSPAPVVYPEHRYRPAPRPYYEPGVSSYLVPATSGVGVHRSRSQGRRSPPSPQPAPVIINNTRIYNDYEDDDYLALAPRQSRDRSSSRHRPSSFVSRDPRDDYELERTRRELETSREEHELEKARKELEKYKIHSTKEDYELERTKKELEAYKLEKEREAEEKRIKKEMELKRLVEEKKADDEKERLKKESEKAIAKYKQEEAEKAAKEKKEKEEREKEYAHRLEDDLRKSGMSEQQISVVLKKDKGVDPNRPTYTRMSRKHLSIETLNRYRIDYEWDQDPDFVLIKRWVPEYEQDFLWAHTKQIRERRRPVMLAIEDGHKHHHHHSEESEFAIVRKKKHERRPSPSPLLTFLAGGKR